MSKDLTLYTEGRLPEFRISDGKAMSALNGREKKFVLAMLEQGANRNAVKKAAAEAGYNPQYGWALIRRHNKLQQFRPYAKQQEFFELGATKRERMFNAGNQLGKSDAGAYETACHVTGIYPPNGGQD
jgi:hypothetical protein